METSGDCRRRLLLWPMTRDPCLCGERLQLVDGRSRQEQPQRDREVVEGRDVKEKAIAVAFVQQ
jgi:hypothetical protein